MTSTITEPPDAFLPPADPPPTQKLLDTIRDSAAAGDAAGDLVATHDLMLAEGLFHILVPRELGGGGGTATDWFDAGLAIAGADPSAGWIMLQGAVQSAWMAVSADPSFAAAFFSNGRRSPPAAQARRRPSATGTSISSATPAGVTCRGPGRVLPRGHGADHRTRRRPETRMVLVPSSEATIEPSWDTHGLRGTGSHHVELGDVVTVPAARTFTWPVLTVVRPGTLATAARHTLWMISVAAAAVNLGAAREHWMRRPPQRTPSCTASTRCRSSASHRSSGRGRPRQPRRACRRRVASPARRALAARIGR